MSEIDGLKEECADKDAEMRRMSAEHIAETARVRTEAQDEISKATAENDAKMTKTKRECDEQISRVSGELSSLQEKHTLACAELLAQRQMNGVKSEEDFTEGDRFLQLEKEYEALGKLLEGEWKKTKKKIRKRIIWNREE
jgi:hypothetical protein